MANTIPEPLRELVGMLEEYLELTKRDDCMSAPVVELKNGIYNKIHTKYDLTSLMVKQYFHYCKHSPDTQQCTKLINVITRKNIDNILFNYLSGDAIHTLCCIAVYVNTMYHNDDVNSLKCQLQSVQLQMTQLVKQQADDRRTIGELRSQLFEVKHIVEPIEYDYDEIAKRIEPIKKELMYTQKLIIRFARQRMYIQVIEAVNACASK